MTTVDFEPIKLTASDESRVRRSSGSKQRYVVPFSMSAKPARDWEDLFDDIWRANRKKTSAPKSHAYIRKGEMVIECALGEIKPLFGNVRSLVEATNEKYGHLLQQKAEKDAKKKRKREEERRVEKQAIHEALADLDF